MASDQNIGWDEASSAIVIPSAESRSSHCVETGTGRVGFFDGLVSRDHWSYSDWVIMICDNN